MVVRHTCSPAMLLPHQNPHDLELLATPSEGHSLPTTAYRLTGIHQLPSGGLPHSTIDILLRLPPGRLLLGSGPHTPAPCTGDRHSNRRRKSDSAKDALSARFARCSIAHIFRVPTGRVLLTNHLDLGSSLDEHDCSSGTIPAVALLHRSDSLATAASKCAGLPLSRKSRTYPHHAA